jgi:methionyl-tRNA formyltransferase
MAPLRIIFMGTPDLAVASLRGLLDDSQFQVVAVVTQPDRPKGRDLQVQPPPVKVCALQARLPVLQPVRARDETFQQQLREYAPDLIAVAAFGQILPPAILELPRHGCLNVHTSLLPRYRGAAPIQWALLNGDLETGVTIMRMEAGLDTGPIVAQESTSIHAEDDALTLHDRLAAMGARLLVRTIPGFVTGQIKPVPQPGEGIVLAPKIRKEQGQINWSRPAVEIWNQTRGLVPWPGAFTVAPANGGSFKIWKSQPLEQSGPAGVVLEAGKQGILVGCGQGSLKILQLQVPGGRRLSAGEFLAGHPINPGQRLGATKV